MDIIVEAFKESIAVKESILSNSELLRNIDLAATWICHSFNEGNKLLLCGNGGSCSDAIHIAEELTGNYRKKRKALPAIPLSDPGHLTCVANDFGYDYVFSRAIEAIGKTGDIILVISTSGNSENILQAIKTAKTIGCKTIGLTGKGGGKLNDNCDLVISVPSQTTSRIQESHITIGHILIELIENKLSLT